MSYSASQAPATRDGLNRRAASNQTRPSRFPQNSLAGLAVPLPPIVKPVVHRSREEVCDTLEQSAQANNLPVPFFIRLLFQESRFQPEAVSAAGAEGVAQFMKETSADRGLENPYDPVQAIPASARLLRDLKQQFGNLGLAAAAYNAGPKRIQDWLAKKGKLPEETEGYVKTITGRPAQNWKAAAASAPAMKLPRHAPCQEIAGLYAWNGPDRIPMPVPSPLARAAAAPTQAATQTVAASIAPVKPTAAVKVASAKTVKPITQVAADAKNPKVAVQLAARTVSKTKAAAKPDQAAHKTAAKPIEVAAAQK